MTDSTKILIIEDNEYLGRMYQNLLNLEGFQAEWVASGEAGLEKAKTTNPDLILLDVIMPKINGIEILEKLKADFTTKDIQVIMLTVIGEKDIIDKCMKIGASGYIIKSNLNLDQLLSEIRTYLRKSSSDNSV